MIQFVIQFFNFSIFTIFQLLHSGMDEEYWLVSLNKYNYCWMLCECIDLWMHECIYSLTCIILTNLPSGLKATAITASAWPMDPKKQIVTFVKTIMCCNHQHCKQLCPLWWVHTPGIVLVHLVTARTLNTDWGWYTISTTFSVSIVCFSKVSCRLPVISLSLIKKV